MPHACCNSTKCQKMILHHGGWSFCRSGGRGRFGCYLTKKCCPRVSSTPAYIQSVQLMTFAFALGTHLPLWNHIFFSQLIQNMSHVNNYLKNVKDHILFRLLKRWHNVSSNSQCSRDCRIMHYSVLRFFLWFLSPKCKNPVNCTSLYITCLQFQNYRDQSALKERSNSFDNCSTIVITTLMYLSADVANTFHEKKTLQLIVNTCIFNLLY